MAPGRSVSPAFDNIPPGCPGQAATDPGLFKMWQEAMEMLPGHPGGGDLNEEATPAVTPRMVAAVATLSGERR